MTANNSNPVCFPLYVEYDYKYIVLNKISSIIGYYVITIISIVGLFMNTVAINVISNKTLLRKHVFYRYILCKTICDWFACLSGIGYMNNLCILCPEILCSTYGIQVYEYYVISIFIRITFFASVWAEVYLNYTRFATLVDTNKFLIKRSIKYYYMTLIVISILPFIPIYFAKSIEPLNPTGYYAALNSFGKSDYFSYYFLPLLLIESVIPMGLLLMLSTLNIHHFRKIMLQKFAKNAEPKNKKTIKKLEIKFTKLIIIITLIFMIAHISDLMSAISIRLLTIGVIGYSPSNYSIINFFRAFTFLISFLQYAIGIFIFASLDRNVSTALKAHFKIQ